MTTIKTISFEKVKLSSWIIWVLYCVITIGLIGFATYPFLAERHYRDGFNLGSGKRYQFAIQELEQAVRYAPWETQYLMELGRMHEEYADTLNNPEEKIKHLNLALENYQKSITLDKQNPWQKNKVAVIYNKLAEVSPEKAGEYTELEKQYVIAAAEADPMNPLFQLNLAYYYHNKQDLEAAKPYYEKVIQMDERIAEASYNLADIYRKEGHIDKSLELYEKIYKHNPKFPNVNLAIAAMLLELNRPLETMPYLEKVVEEYPQHREALRNLGGLYHKAQNWEKSAYYYNRLYAIYPEERPSTHQFYIQALVQSNQIQPAIDALHKYIKDYPNDNAARKQLAAILSAIQQ